MGNKKCPRCLDEINTSSNRLITENCGHMKCRKCFLSEENGCSDCITKNGQNVEKVDFMNIANSELDGSKLSDIESNSGELCIDTEDDNSSVEPNEHSQNCLSGLNENLDEDQKPMYSIENIRNEFEDRKSDVIILEHMIIPPKDITESFPKREKKNDGRKPRELRSFPEHIIKINEDGKVYFKCTICEKRFRSRNQRYYHIYCNLEKAKPFRCKLCDKSFATSSHLNYHEKTHTDTNRYYCKLCSKSFCREISLNKHTKWHEGNFKYNCEYCNEKFFENFRFQAHINTHNNIFPFKCEVCGKMFSYKSNLKQHKLTHSETRNFNCEYCNKSFDRKSSYKEHLLRHSKARDFMCTICTNTFIDRKTLERHIKTHNGKQSYVCPFCMIKTIRKDNLIRHIRNMHSKENVAEALLNIKKCSETIQMYDVQETSNITQYTDTSVEAETEELKLDLCTEEEKSSKIVIGSAVIRSIGNVKPVLVPQDCDIKMKLSSNNNANKSSIKPNVRSVSNAISQPISKPKKRYDPCEIYRKILLDTNDDDDLTLDNGELHSDSKDAHTDCCNEPLNNVSIGKSDKFETHSPSHFTEMHWRKRTSQYFFSAM